MAEHNTLRRNLLLLCIPLLLGGIAAEGYLLLRPAPVSAPPAAVSTAEPEPDPAALLLDAVRADDAEAAAALMQRDFAEADVPAEALEILQARADAVLSDYLADAVSAAEAETAAAHLEAFGFPALHESLRSIRGQISRREAARDALSAGETQLAAGDEIAARDSFRKVPQSESDLYAEAQAQITRCETQYREKITAAAQSALDEKQYDESESLLREALENLPDDADLAAMLSDAEQAHSHIVLLNALQSARIAFDAGNYTEAFEALGQIPDTESENPAVQHMRQSYRAMYLMHLQTDTEALMQQGKLDQAAARIAEAETLFPDAAEPQSLRALMAEYHPAALQTLEKEEFADCFTAEAALTDCFGNTYSAEGGNLYYSYDGTLTGRQNASAGFYTSGSYSQLSLTAVPMDTFADDRIVMLEISGDGKALETYAVSVQNGVLHIELDITGVRLLRFRVRPYGTDDLRSCGVILADGTVRKK